MVNVTYDQAGQFIWVDKNGKTFVYNESKIAWTLAATALVWIMTPGVGFFYSGMLRRKNALSMLYLSLGVIGVVTFQWFLWGFSLAFSDTGSPFLGNFRYFALRGVLENPSMAHANVPSVVYCIYQLMFATMTPMLMIGAVAERGRIGPCLIFLFLWTTLIYDPIAYWTWNANGWSHRHGILDFAGGTVVHLSSGTSALAIAIFLGVRNDFEALKLSPYKAHNTSYVFLGTVLMWFGWFGFNGGSTLAANLRAAQACLVTTISASIGGMTWMLWEYLTHKKWSAVGFCAGAVASLVAITPAAGFVGAPAAFLFGLVAGTLCNKAIRIRQFFEWDDALDIFALHAIGGLVGNIMTGIFAQKSIASLDGTVIAGGWLDHHWEQMAWQLANSAAGMSYSFAGTTIILWIMRYIPLVNLDIRCDADTEALGIDAVELGEYAYDFVEREIAPLLQDSGRSDDNCGEPTINGNRNGGDFEMEQYEPEGNRRNVVID